MPRWMSKGKSSFGASSVFTLWHVSLHYDHMENGTSHSTVLNRPIPRTGLAQAHLLLITFIRLVNTNAAVLLVSSEVTHYELLMGEHLRVWSETEYTNAGEVMQNVGKLQEEDAKAR